MGRIDNTVAFFLIIVTFCVGYWLVSKLFQRFNLPKFGERHKDRQNSSFGNDSGQQYKGKQAGHSETRETERDKYYDELLELKGDHSVENIKRKYREKQAKYHPDKVHHLGHEFQQMAEKKARVINEAYEFFKQRYKFS